MESDNNSRHTERLGFQGKSLWDYVQLLIVPVFLGGAAIWFQFESSNAARESEERRAIAQQEIQDTHAREEALQGYLDRMTELLLSEDAQGDVFPEKMRSVARARTISVIRVLDDWRNRSVTGFLHDAELVRKTGESEQDALISLMDADLSNSELMGAMLLNASLHGANLTNANMQRAPLQDTNLIGTDLSNTLLAGANLKEALMQGAILCTAFMVNANLEEANLEGAKMLNANLFNSNLRGANLRDSDFRDAAEFGEETCGNLHLIPNPQGFGLHKAVLNNVDLSDANLTGAKVDNGQLAQAASLVGATMPDGSLMDEARWESFKQQNGGQ